MEVKKLNAHEITAFRTLIEIFREVFENPIEIPDADHLSKVISNADFMVFVVKINDKVVGGLTAYVLNQYYSTKPLVYIYDLGIASDFQGKGLGKALINEVCTFCRANGFDEAYVEAESDDLDAINFYRKTNFTKEINATHFTYALHDI